MFKFFCGFIFNKEQNLIKYKIYKNTRFLYFLYVFIFYRLTTNKRTFIDWCFISKSLNVKAVFIKVIKAITNQFL